MVLSRMCAVRVDSVCACNQATERFVIVPNRDQLDGIAIRERVEMDQVEQCSKIATTRSLYTGSDNISFDGANRVYGDFMCVCSACVMC